MSDMSPDTVLTIGMSCVAKISRPDGGAVVAVRGEPLLSRGHDRSLRVRRRSPRVNKHEELCIRRSAERVTIQAEPTLRERGTDSS